MSAGLSNHTEAISSNPNPESEHKGLNQVLVYRRA